MDSIREMWFAAERMDRHPEVGRRAEELAAGGVVTEAVWAAAWRAVFGDGGASGGAVVVELPVRPVGPSVLVVAA